MPPGFLERRRHSAEETTSSFGEEWGKDEDEGLTKEEIYDFVEAFAMSQYGDDFPAWVAREMQSKLWQRSSAEVIYAVHIKQPQPLITRQMELSL